MAKFTKDDIVKTKLGDIGFIRNTIYPEDKTATIWLEIGAGEFGITQVHTLDSLERIGHIGKCAPRGYRIERWADGVYHVNDQKGCFAETLTKRLALIKAWLCQAKAGQGR